ncbi:unnamed protein product [Peniophora sp. CBMAI 1063]|nr:unnamed protein product [Peniophora sp. CBMAI 1063]
MDTTHDTVSDGVEGATHVADDGLRPNSERPSSPDCNPEPEVHYRRNMSTSSACRLPPEILSHIFTLDAEKHKSLWSLKWTRLMLVCRRFREIGLQHCELWSYITLRITSDSDHDGLLVRRARAKGDPLTIKVHYDQAMADYLDVMGGSFWDSGALKWLSISFASQAPSPKEFMRDLTAHVYPEMECLFLHNLDRSQATNCEEIISSFLTVATAPKLRSLGLPFVPMGMAIDLPSLRSFSMSTVSLDEHVITNLAAFLQRCPRTRTLSFNQLDTSWNGANLNAVPSRVALPEFEHLHHFGGLRFANALLESLTLPRANSILLLLNSVESPQEIKRLADNVKVYLHDSEEARVAAHALRVHRGSFSTYPPPGFGDKLPTMSLMTGGMFGSESGQRTVSIMLPAFLIAGNLAEVDVRFRGDRDYEDPPMGVPSNLGTPGRAILLVRAEESAQWTLDVLQKLLRVETRTRITGICVDLLMWEDHDRKDIRKVIKRLCEFVYSAKDAGKAIEVVEFICGDAPDNVLRLIPSKTLEKLVTLKVQTDEDTYSSASDEGYEV